MEPAVKEKGVQEIRMFFIYNWKTTGANIISHPKIRAVVMGNTCKEGVDFSPDRVFSPVVRQETVNLLLATAVQRNYHVLQMDLRQAFLSQPIDNEEHPRPIYLRFPPGSNIGLEGTEFNTYVMKNNIYGYPEASFAFNRRIDRFLTNPKKFLRDQNADIKDVKIASKFEFNRSKTDVCLYNWLKKDPKSGRVIADVSICTYVDDFAIISKNGLDSEELKEFEYLVNNQGTAM